MFVIVQGLLSDDYVTQGYGVAVAPPPVPPTTSTPVPGLSESTGTHGGYTVPNQEALRVLYGPDRSPWQSDFGPALVADQRKKMVRLRKRFAVILAAALGGDGVEVLR